MGVVGGEGDRWGVLDRLFDVEVRGVVMGLRLVFGLYR